MKRILAIITLFFTIVLSSDGATKQFTLCIDAGHGGKDTGAKGKSVNEKTLTLRYAMAFGRVIEQNCPDVKVIYTRRSDRFLELWQRAEIANNARADLFISVHINALPGKRVARGYQTYTLGRSRRDGNTHGFEENLEVAKRENAVILYEDNYQQHYEGFDPNSPESNILFELIQDKNMEQSIMLAKYMQQYVCAATGRQDKGVHQDNLAVLRKASMPACLLELGFISTPDEEQFLNSDRAVAQYSRGFYNAFVAYKTKVTGRKTAYRPLPELPVVQSQPTIQEPQIEQEQPVAREQTAVKEQPAIKEQLPAQQPDTLQKAVTDGMPVFKVQVLANATKVKKNSPMLKGRTDADYYVEGGLYKYTVGASSDYQAIFRLRKELLPKFPEAFIIAFKDGVKINVNDARKMMKR